MKRRLTYVVIAGVVAASCGSKGDPLPPLRPVPVKVAGLTATRIEGRPVTLQFVVPAANQDGETPVDIAEVRVYAITQPASSPAPTALDLLGGELVVATIEVAAPAPPSEAPAPPAPAPPATAAPAPGATVTWEDTAETTTYATPMVRYYSVVGVSSQRRVGAMSDVVTVPLTPLEGVPSNLTASFTAGAIKLDWLGVAAATRYRVYEVAKDAPAGVGVALNPAPIEGTTFEVPIGAVSAEPGAAPAYGVERCFIVRAALAAAGGSVESAAAGPVCVTPRDVFAPPAPANLTAIASEGAINLIWDAVDAADLAGYIVLRGEAGGETLQPLFEAPITETRYRDATAVAGTRYIYAVVAADTASPANRGAESNRVTETGRN